MLKFILSAVIAFILVGLFFLAQGITGCIDSMKYEMYQVEEIEKNQYILTTPEDEKYVTFEELIWYPKEKIFDEAVGICKLGRIYRTESDICLYVDDMRGSYPSYFFKEGTLLPELSIENVSNTVLQETYNNDEKIVVDRLSAEKFIELYNDTQSHEMMDIHSMDRVWELSMESKEFEGLYFSKSLYSDGNDYFLYIRYDYNSEKGLTTNYFINCTTVINEILDNK